jgi:hypothetical protein
MVAIKYQQLIESGYELKFHFVVIDKAFQTYPFYVTEPTLQSWLTRMDKVLDSANWHYVNKRYDLPHDFAVGNVVL